MPSRNDAALVDLELHGFASGYVIPPGYATLASNLRRNRRGGWQSCWGEEEVIAAGATGYVSGIWAWRRGSGEQRFLAWERESVAGDDGLALVVFRGLGGGSVASLATGRRHHMGPWARTSTFTYGGWLYLFNGEDTPICTDGYRTEPVGWTRLPAAPRVTGVPSGAASSSHGVDILDENRNLTTGGYVSGSNERGARGVGEYVVDTGATIEWNYGYRVSHVNERGQISPPSEPAWIRGFNTEADGKRYVLVRLSSAPAGTIGQIVWRTENVVDLPPDAQRQARFYQLGVFPHAHPLQHPDGASDAELGAELDEDAYGLVPATAGLCCVFKNTAFYAGMRDYPDTVAYSAPAFVEQVPTRNRFVLADSNGGGVRALFAARDAVYVFKENATYAITGDPVNGFAVRALPGSRGSSSPRGVVDVPGVGTFFPCEEGVFAIVGSMSDQDNEPARIVPVGAPIDDWWRDRVTMSALAGIQAAVYRADREVWFSVPIDGSPLPSKVLVFHYDVGEWTLRDHPVSCLVEDDRGQLYYGIGGGGVFAYADTGDLHGSAITSTWRSGWIDFGRVYDRVIVQQVSVYAVAHEQTMTLRARSDRQDAWRTDTEARTSRDAEYTQDVWDTAVWGTSEIWQAWKPAPVTFATPGRPEQTFEVMVELSGVELEVLAMELEVVPGPARKRKVDLTQALRSTT